MTTLYKDFSKDCKDFLTKNYPAANTWQIESKFKGPKGKVFVNPQATSGKGLSADVEYIAPSGPYSVKVTADEKCNVKATGTYEANGHKVEVGGNKKAEYEVVYEGKVSPAAFNAKLTKDAFDGAVAVAVLPYAAIGAGGCYDLGKKTCKWTIGARYAAGGNIVTVVTEQLKKHITSVVVPLAIADRKVTVAAQCECGSGAFAGTVGIETSCIVWSENTLKVKVDNNLSWAIAYLVKLSDNWTAAVSVDTSLACGVQFTRK